MNDFAPWSLAELVRDLRSGATTPVAAMQRSRERIAATDLRVRAWVETGFDDFDDQVAGSCGPEPLAGSETRPASEARGLLGGIPLGVKDIIDARGFPTRCGSALRETAPPCSSDAAIVSAWYGAGATPIGKTVTTEFAYFSPGPTRNPAAPGCTPGGSSSGSAAAVAAGQVPLALGSQTAASVTRPAAFCGVASLVMTRGRFATGGVVGLASSLDSHGFFAAGVRDLATAWAALNGDRTAAGVAGDAPRLLVWDGGSLGDLSDDMAVAVDEAVARLRARGAEVELLSESALVAEVAEAHPVIMGYEAARERAAELERAEELSPQLRALLEGGSSISCEDYEAARTVTARARGLIASRLANGSAIVGPAALGAAPAGLSATGDPLLSRPWQALGLPAAAIPGLRDPDGRPLGIQLIGAANRETALLGAAEWVEARLTP